MRRFWSIATIALALSGPVAAEDAVKPKTPEQKALADLKPQIVGAWAQVTAKVAGRIENTALVSAAGRCTNPPALSAADTVRLGMFTDGGTEARRAAMQLFRGDLAFQDKGDALVRIDYIEKFKATVERVSREENERGRAFFVLDFGRIKMPVVFHGGKIGRTDVLYMVQNEALYLKCPPIPVR